MSCFTLYQCFGWSGPQTKSLEGNDTVVVSTESQKQRQNDSDDFVVKAVWYFPLFYLTVPLCKACTWSTNIFEVHKRDSVYLPNQFFLWVSSVYEALKVTWEDLLEIMVIKDRHPPDLCPLPTAILTLHQWLNLWKHFTGDRSHPGHGLFKLLPSGQRYRTLCAKSSRLKNNFVPQAAAQLTLLT